MPRPSTTRLQSAEYRQHEVSGRNDSNKLYNLNFNDTTHNNGNHNNNTGTNPSQGGESNKAHGDGNCNENGGTQGGTDNSDNDYDNQNDESSDIPTSVTPSSAIASSIGDLPVKNKASNTPVATVTAVTDLPTLTTSATFQCCQILSLTFSSDSTSFAQKIDFSGLR